jgi:hypothetical protein
MLNRIKDKNYQFTFDIINIYKQMITYNRFEIFKKGMRDITQVNKAGKSVILLADCP